MVFSFRRLVAELIGVFDYRTYQRKYWDLRSGDLATRYDHKDDFEALAQILSRYQAGVVWDIGCGNGRLFPLYVKAGVHKVIAIELSPVLVEEAHRKMTQLACSPSTEVEIFCQDVRSPLPTVTTPPDVIVTSRVLQHIHSKDIEAVVNALVSLNPTALYINETRKRTALAYIFQHDYETLFKNWGYVLREEGIVPRIDYEFQVFVKNGT